MLDDTLYPQLHRAMRRIASVLKDAEFVVMRSMLSEAIESRIYMVLEMEVWSLPSVKKMEGPYIEAKKNVKDFLKKYKEEKKLIPYVEGKVWHVDKPRENRDAIECVRSFLSQELSELAAQGIPKKIADVMFRAKLLEHDDFWSVLRSNAGLSDLLRQKYFESAA